MILEGQVNFLDFPHVYHYSLDVVTPMATLVGIFNAHLHNNSYRKDIKAAKDSHLMLFIVVKPEFNFYQSGSLFFYLWEE